MSKLIASLVAFILLAPCGHAEPYQLRSPIGTNLNGIEYWSSQVPFVDVMKSSGTWISGDKSKWDNKQPLDLDANGWVRSLTPGQIARTLMLRELGDRYPAGQYTVRYKGQGTLIFSAAASVVSQKPGEINLQVTPAKGGITMEIMATNSADYLRDIRITLPGGLCDDNPFRHVASAQQCNGRRFLSYADHSESIIFSPVFLDRLRAYSVLRFMDWMQTNGSPVQTWSQRKLASNRTWTGSNGAPIEVMIELSNRLDAHPWFTLPHQSDDAYARELAQVVKAKLNPGLRVYVEHSNEVWNGQFAQHNFVIKQAAAQSPAIDNMQYHALRSRTAGGIFKEVLGPARVVTVLGAQAANLWTASHGLEYLKRRFGGGVGIDAVAIAPYIGVMPKLKEASTYSAMTLDDLFDRLRTKALPEAGGRISDYRKLVNAYGLSLIAYEGGQHMVGILGAENDNELTKLFLAFNRDQRIKQLYLDYLAEWKRAGGELFVHFHDVGQYGKWGSWGALEFISQPREAAPKFDALQTFIERNPVWWKQ
jgi:hypothetical protein